MQAMIKISTWFFSKNKNIKFTLLFFFHFQSLSAQRFLVADSNHLWGITDRKGNYIIQPEYDSIKESLNDAVNVSDYSFFVLYKNNKKGLAVQDYNKDTAKNKSKYLLLLSLHAEFDSLKAADRIIFAYKDNKMAVYSFWGKLLLPFKADRKCCVITLSGPNGALLKSTQTQDMWVEVKKKKEIVELMHKKNHSYAKYGDNIIAYGNEYYRINYNKEWPGKAKTVTKVKLSKIMQEEVDWCIRDFCTTQFNKQNIY